MDTAVPKRRLVFNLMAIKERFDPGEFSAFAAMAAEYGATHVNVGVLPFAYSWFLPDLHDPYPSWANWSMGLFRVFTPPALQEWIPPESSQALQEILQEKMTILRGLGLRATVSNGVEPCWLPEGVYRAHPHWRGAQCELGRIAGKPYFSPSIDEPEVLELYGWALEECGRLFPEIDDFQFLTNDSSAGISWSAFLYPGVNGPAAYRQRGPGERVSGWLQTMVEGAARAGSEVRFNLNGGLTVAEREAIRAKLTPGTYLSGAGSDGTHFRNAGANLGAGYWTQAWPAVGINNMIAFAEGLQPIFDPEADPQALSAEISMDEYGLPLARVLLDSARDNPGVGLLHRDRVLLHAGAKLAGETQAEALVRVWESVNSALHAVAQIRVRGASDILFGETVSRWLIRPLVPRPLELTEAEKAHYEPFLFSVGTDEQNANLGYLCGKPVLLGDGVVWMARWACQEAIGTLQGASRSLQSIVTQAGEAATSEVQLYHARVQALCCVIENVKLTIMYQHALNIADLPRFGANTMDYDDNINYDQRCLELRKIARADLDNTTALIQLLRAHAEPVIGVAETPEGETVFKFGPDLVASLQRKQEIMLDHWHDYERMYPTSKEWDFEPARMRGGRGDAAGCASASTDAAVTSADDS